MFKKKKERDKYVKDISMRGQYMKEFIGISKRGIGAYAVCCLENALKKHNLRNESWDLVLDVFWAFTNVPLIARYDLENLMTFSYQLLEKSVSRYVENRMGPASNKLEDLRPEEITQLYNMYKKSGLMIAELVEIVNDVQYCEFNGGSVYPFFMTFEALEKLINLMKANDIPLPDLEMFRQHTYNRMIPEGEEDYGKVFDGKAMYSEYFKQS